MYTWYVESYVESYAESYVKSYVRAYVSSALNRTLGGHVATACINIKKVTATDLRDRLKSIMRAAQANKVVLVENRRQPAKYLVDKDFLDSLMRERQSIMATLEILSDRELTNRLLGLAKTIDEDIAAGRLLTHEEVFG